KVLIEIWPLGLPNCVRPFDPKLSEMLPSATPFTVMLGMVRVAIGGFILPFVPKGELVATVFQALWVPGALPLVWVDGFQVSPPPTATLLTLAQRNWMFAGEPALS